MTADLRATKATINLSAIAHNVGVFRERLHPGAAMMAVVKANGYGHGAIPTARAAIGAGANWLGVAVAEEGRELRRAGIAVPVLVLGSSNPQQMELAIEEDLDVTISDLSAWQSAVDCGERLGKKPRVHLKVDTGMGRLGVASASVVTEWAPRLSDGRVVWQGLMSHLADSDGPEDETTRAQLSQFLDVIESLRASEYTLPPILHLANSAAALRYPGTHFGMVRIGIGLYGAVQYPGSPPLEPALSWETSVTLVKRVAQGTRIGYGGTFAAPSDCTIATLAIGYADGFRRSLSNRAEVLIHGHRCPVAGRVSMDQTTVMVPDGVAVQAGDRAILIGEDGGSAITVHEVAVWADTIAYEILTGISDRVARRYLGNTSQEMA